MFRLLEQVEDPRSVAAFRVAFGALLAMNLLSLWPHAGYLYGAAGVMPAETFCTGLRRASLMCHVGGSSGPHGVLAASVFSAALFTVGVWTRFTKWTTAYLFVSVVLRNPLPLAGEQVFGSFLFLLCLSRCGSAYSLDEWWRSRRGQASDGPTQIPAWPRMLMIFQLCLAYGVAGWAKTGPTYLEGNSLYYVLANDRWFRFEPWWLLSTFGTNALVVATWIAWGFERLFPLVGVGLAWGHRSRVLRWMGSRWIWAPLSVAFTGVLIVFANIGWFVPATLVATLALFRGEEVGRIIARCMGRPFVPAETRVDRAGPWRSRMLAVFVGWHVLATTTNALALKTLALPVPAKLHRVTHSWGRATNTFQFWGMFSPNAPGVRNWLVIDLQLRNGDRVPAFDDRVLVGQREHPYLLIDRRQKIHSKLMRPRNARLHADWLCRTWRDDNGQAPSSVSIQRWRWPLPNPGWMAANGNADPRPAAERDRQTFMLAKETCAE